MKQNPFQKSKSIKLDFKKISLIYKGISFFGSKNENIAEGDFQSVDTKFSDLISYSESILLSAKVLHWNPKNEPRHRAFGDFYDSFLEYQDKFVELGLSFSEPFGINSNTSVIIPYDESLLYSIFDFSRELVAFGKAKGYISLENLGQDIFEAGAKLQYKLKLNDFCSDCETPIKSQI